MPNASPFRRWIESRAITQHDIVERGGFSASQVSRWAAGKRTPPAPALQKMGAVFGATPDEIMGRAPTPIAPLRSVAGLTPAEGEILRHLALARETFARLTPARSPEQIAEFTAAIEGAHAAVIVHKAARANLEAWVGFV